jgi:dihydrofolate synthase/folylpolyglutamate synthase
MIKSNKNSNYLQEIYNPKINYLKEILNKLDKNILTSFKNVIQITGTNGKGSTTAFLRSILETSDFSVNVFTSPHLINERERIRIHSKLITESYLQDIKTLVQETINNIKKENPNIYQQDLGFFYLYTIYALFAFFKNPADFTILEVGIGGRYDSTNILPQNLVAIFSSISLDHKEFLGNTQAKIALEKSFIIKKDSIVISSHQTKKVLEVLKNQSINFSAKNFIHPKKDYFIKNNILYYQNKKISLQSKFLQGDIQNQNAALAAVTALTLNHKFNIKKIEKGLSLAQWEGRNQIFTNLYNLQLLSPNKILLDGAHNINGLKLLLKHAVNELKFNSNNTILIFGMLSKKDIKAACNLIIDSIFQDIYIIQINSQESATQEEIKTQMLQIAQKSNKSKNILSFLNIQDVFKFLIKNNLNNKNIIICGSLYLVGEILSDNNIAIK